MRLTTPTLNAVKTDFSIGGEFYCTDLEQAFRAAHGADERRQLIVLWGWAVCLLAAFGAVDAVTHPLDTGLGLRLGARGVIILTALVVVSRSCREPDYRKRDRWALWAYAAVAICYPYAIIPSSSGSIGAIWLLVVGMYLFSPGRFWWTVCAGVCCCGTLALSLYFFSSSAIQWFEFCYLWPAQWLAALALAHLNRERRRRWSAQCDLAEAHEGQRQLLLSAVPERVVKKLPVLGFGDRLSPLATERGQAAVVFADLAGFSLLARRLSATRLLHVLDHLYSRFDGLAERWGVEKIKTVGDAWFGVGGLASNDGIANTVQFAIALRDVCADVAERQGLTLQVRVAVVHGDLIAGVIGRQRLAYDVWGHTVNRASRLQGMAEPGQVLISESCLPLAGLTLGPALDLQLRGCGHLRAYEVRGLNPVVRQGVGRKPRHCFGQR